MASGAVVTHSSQQQQKQNKKDIVPREINESNEYEHDMQHGKSVTHASMNPFSIPTDREVFESRAQVKKAEQEMRANLKVMSVVDKTTFRSRLVTRKPSRDNVDLAKKRGAPRMHGKPAMAGIRKERENLHEFVQKKREMFLIQMTLNTKKEEIKKLEETARTREEELERQEKALHEDQNRFDQFLKENDMRAAETMKRADAEAKLKSEKIAEIKRLNGQIAAVKSEMSKYEERLEEARKYKEFLDKLTPLEWFQKYKDLQKRGEEVPMYFSQPSQLLDVLGALEERNLFLIQNTQEMEENLELRRQKFNEGKVAMDAEADALHQQIQSLEQAIQREEEATKTIQDLITCAEDGGEEREKLLERMHAKISEVYTNCGFEDTRIGPLEMLSGIEARLEEYLGYLDQLPPEYVVAAEKDKERERRRQARIERQAQEKQQQEERMRKALERSQAPVVKRAGKPVMFKSHLLPHESKRKGNQGILGKNTHYDDDIREFFTP